jgi:hypothetical protein
MPHEGLNRKRQHAGARCCLHVASATCCVLPTAATCYVELRVARSPRFTQPLVAARCEPPMRPTSSKLRWTQHAALSRLRALALFRTPGVVLLFGRVDVHGVDRAFAPPPLLLAARPCASRLSSSAGISRSSVFGSPNAWSRHGLHWLDRGTEVIFEYGSSRMPARSCPPCLSPTSN